MEDWLTKEVLDYGLFVMALLYGIRELNNAVTRYDGHQRRLIETLLTQVVETNQKLMEIIDRLDQDND